MTSQPAPRRRWDAAAVSAVLVLSSAVAVLALGTADGVTRVGPGTYRTEFVTVWWWLAFLLVPVPALTVRRHPVTALVAGVALVVPHVVAAGVVVGRYRSSGWADGLAVLAFAHPLLLAVLTGAVVAASRPRRRIGAAHPGRS